jgi:hypothetical protein
MNQRVLVTAGASGIGREIFNFLHLSIAEESESFQGLHRRSVDTLCT